MAGLTNKQQAFVEAYLANGFNATKAAITAGYSEKTARSIGAENLTKPDISDTVKQRMAELCMSADEALMRLSQMARAQMSLLVTKTAGRLPMVDWEAALESGAIDAVKELTIREGEIGFKLHDAQAALVHILKEQHLRAGEATERSDLTTLGERLAAPMVYLPAVDDAGD